MGSGGRVRRHPGTGARENNLRDVSVDIPKRQLTVVTGVSGSGKSSLVFDTIAAESQRLVNETYSAFVQNFLPHHGRPDVDSVEDLSAAIVVDQARMGSNARSTVGTATDASALLRILYSRVGEPRVWPASALSFNDREFLTEEQAQPVLAALADVGLPYVTLGQPLSTLSGGERQRLELAVEMTGDAEVHVLDEPTSGLHVDDVDGLIGLLHRLVDGGRTVVVVEHDLDVVAEADWVVDLGPGAGHDGGRVVFTGTPADLAASGTLTGRHLAARAG